MAPLVDYIKANPYVIQNAQQAQQGTPQEAPQEEFPEAFRGDSYKQIGDEFEKLYKLEAENFGSELPKPKDKYGFDEGLITDEELEKVLRKDLEEKQMLEDFDVTDREPNETGGLAGILKL